jgi:hypothetical protein
VSWPAFVDHRMTSGLERLPWDVLLLQRRWYRVSVGMTVLGRMGWLLTCVCASCGSSEVVLGMLSIARIIHSTSINI